MKRSKEFNNKKIIFLYFFSFLSIVVWFFFISVEINVKTSINGNKISIQKEKKLPKSLCSKIRKVSLQDSAELYKPIVLDVLLLSEDDKKCIYEIIPNEALINYNKSTIFVNFYQLF